MITKHCRFAPFVCLALLTLATNAVAQKPELIVQTGDPSIFSFAFSPDGKVLAGGSDDSTIKIWDVESGKKLRTLRGHSARVISVSFSPNGKMLASRCLCNEAIKIWDVESSKELRTLRAYSFVSSVSFSPDGKTLASGSWDTKIRLWDVATGEELVSLIALDENDWVVTTPDGRFDTNKDLNNIEGLHWVVSDNPLKPVPLEVFMRDYYEPGLFARMLKCTDEGKCDKEFAPLPNIAELNRVQPSVKITGVSLPDSNRTVKVSVEVGKGFVPAKDCKMKRCETDAFDLRLFRDGQIVGTFPADSQEKLVQQHDSVTDDLQQRRKQWRDATEIKLDEKTGKRTLTFDVQLPKGKSAADVQFTAYAFNEDRVKSATASWSWPESVKAGLPKAQAVNRRAFIVSVGVNAYENSIWDLRYAANDASEMQKVLTENLVQTKQYEVVGIPLISDYDASGKLSVNDATKAKIKTVLDLLAGKKPDETILAELKQSVPAIEKLQQATPDDIVIISFSTHGYADNKGNFFILPHDIGKEEGQRITSKLLSHSISSDELSLWLRDIDGGEMAMIIDACHAAAAVENKEFKPGPMGSRGLGQLAYDKGMKILTATQAADFALESEGLKQGLLSYALLQDGLLKWQADFKPAGDGKITLHEWLSFGVAQVPKLYEDVRKGKRSLVIKGDRVNKERAELAFSKDKKLRAAVQQPSLFDFNHDKASIVVSRMFPLKKSK